VIDGKRSLGDRVTQDLNREQVLSDTEASMGPRIRFPQGSVDSSPSLGSSNPTEIQKSKVRDQNDNLKCKDCDLCPVISALLSLHSAFFGNVLVI